MSFELLAETGIVFILQEMRESLAEILLKQVMSTVSQFFFVAHVSPILRYLTRTYKPLPMSPTRTAPCASELPEIRHEAVSHLLLVFFIPCQIFLQEFLLVEDSQNQHRNGESKNQESPPGPECEWDARDHDQNSNVHRMPNTSIETGRDD